MKKIIVIITVIFLLIIGSFLFFRKNANLLSNDEALLIGENKYREFLWMTDGAFNDIRYGGVIEVNNNPILDNEKLITCNYISNKRCVTDNFIENYKYLFSKDIPLDIVYGDMLTYKWFYIENDKYYFENPNICENRRMNISHTLEVKEIKTNQITYLATFQDAFSDKIYKKDFILKLEDDEWKVYKGFYKDPCSMDYNIDMNVVLQNK